MNDRWVNAVITFQVPLEIAVDAEPEAKTEAAVEVFERYFDFDEAAEFAGTIGWEDVEESEAESLRRELLLALSDEWTSTPDLARAVGVSRFQSITPVRDALYLLRDDGRVELERRAGSPGYLWRLKSIGGSSGC